jgi:Xaa-Pro dipeptidase
MERRRAAIKGALADAGCDHLVFCDANRFGSGVQWLTGWPVTAEAVGIFTPDRPDVAFIQYHSRVPLARRLASPRFSGERVASACEPGEGRASRTL